MTSLSCPVLSCPVRSCPVLPHTSPLPSFAFFKLPTHPYLSMPCYTALDLSDIVSYDVIACNAREGTEGYLTNRHTMFAGLESSQRTLVPPSSFPSSSSSSLSPSSSNLDDMRCMLCEKECVSSCGDDGIRTEKGENRDVIVF
jgi:hypothetical protein